MRQAEPRCPRCPLGRRSGAGSEDSRPLGGQIGETTASSTATRWATITGRPAFRDEFIKLRGYDPTAFLPVLSGRYVESGEVTERFLWDFRRTIGESIRRELFRLLRRSVPQAWAEILSRALRKVLSSASRPAPRPILIMGEFWVGASAAFRNSVKWRPRSGIRTAFALSARNPSRPVPPTENGCNTQARSKCRAIRYGVRELIASFSTPTRISPGWTRRRHDYGPVGTHFGRF